MRCVEDVPVTDLIVTARETGQTPSLGHESCPPFFAGRLCADAESINNQRWFSADGLHRASLHAIDGSGFLFRSRGLMVDHRVSDVVIAPVDFRCCFPAEIAVDALAGDVEWARDVFRKPFTGCGHVGS